MPRYHVNFVSRLWLEVEVIAPTQEAAEAKARKKIDQYMNSNGVVCLDGGNDLCGITNLTLLNKLPKE